MQNAFYDCRKQTDFHLSENHSRSFVQTSSQLGQFAVLWIFERVMGVPGTLLDIILTFIMKERNRTKCDCWLDGLTGPSKEMASVWFMIKSNLGEKEVNLSSQSQAIVHHYVEIKVET